MNTSPYKISSAARQSGEALKTVQRFIASAGFLCFGLVALGQVPCENGMAGEYPCLGMDLMCVKSVVEMGGLAEGNGNDCWGWASEGREFMLFGRSDGTTVIDVTDPVNPIIMSDIPTASVPSLWRDIKVIGDVAYIVSEAGQHGMQVVDLSQLPFSEPGAPLGLLAYYTGFGSAHNVVANPETGFIYGVGTDTFDGGLHIVDANDPSNPTLAGAWAEDYIHDAQAVLYAGPDTDHAGKEIVFAFSGYSGCHIIDVDDKLDCQTLSTMTNEEWVYPHQGWLTADHRYMLMNDEIDESNGIAPLTRTWIFDVQDLDNPVAIGFHEGTLGVTDHNLYIHEGRAYEANYYAGMQVLDLVDLANGEMEMTAYFDTNPYWDGVGTSGGAWNVYPFFESGNIAISTQSHFFMVRPSGWVSQATGPGDSGWVGLTLHADEGQVRLRSALSGRVRVFGPAGRLKTTWPVQSSGWSTFTVEGWSAGIYVVRTESGLTQRFVVR